jgi:twitching motility protein PilU
MDLSLNLKGLISQCLVPKKEAKGGVVAMEIMKKSRELGMQTFDQALFDLYEAGNSKHAKNRDFSAGTETLGLI